jgi:hypothetical protein
MSLSGAPHWFGLRRVLAVAGLAAVVSCAAGADNPDELDELGDVSGDELTVGHCLAEFPDAAVLASIEPLPCSERHSDEIYASGSLADGAYPGTSAVEVAARDLCLAEFEAFVGIPYDDSVLDIGYLTPTESAWTDGDRKVLCTIFDPAEEVTGSLRSAER